MIFDKQKFTWFIESKEFLQVTEQQIPSTAELFGKEIDPYSNTIYTTNYGNPTSLTNLAPMPDGTFVFSGGNHVSIQGDAYETKDVMLSIDPAQTAVEEAVKLMPGSIHGTNKYMATTLKLESGVPHLHHWAWRLQGTLKHSRDIHTAAKIGRASCRERV